MMRVQEIRILDIIILTRNLFSHMVAKFATTMVITTKIFYIRVKICNALVLSLKHGSTA